NIIDYTGSATRLFADPDFDGEPALVEEQQIDEQGQTTAEEVISEQPHDDDEVLIDAEPPVNITTDGPTQRRKYYYDGGSVEIAAHLVYELDGDGAQLRVVSYQDYTAERVRSIVRDG